MCAVHGAEAETQTQQTSERKSGSWRGYDDGDDGGSYVADENDHDGYCEDDGKGDITDYHDGDIDYGDGANCSADDNHKDDHEGHDEH